MRGAEEWRPVVGNEDRYLVSNRGRVFQLPHVVMRKGRPVRRGSRMKKLSEGAGGYRVTGIRGRHMLVHRLVLEAFVGPCPEGMEGCHNDGDKTNNRLENLRWDTRSANLLDRRAHGVGNGSMTHCRQGHPFDAENTYVKPGTGQRVCRTCMRGYDRAYRQRKRGVAA